PASRASFQCEVARGPGPTVDIEYSPTLDFTPPRTIGIDHSLTDCSHTLLGSVRIISAASPSFHPQSHTITFASGFPRCTPASIVEFTSAMIAAADRPLQCGQFFC